MGSLVGPVIFSEFVSKQLSVLRTLTNQETLSVLLLGTMKRPLMKARHMWIIDWNQKGHYTTPTIFCSSMNKGWETRLESWNVNNRLFLLLLLYSCSKQARVLLSLEFLIKGQQQVCGYFLFNSKYFYYMLLTISYSAKLFNTSIKYYKKTLIQRWSRIPLGVENMFV